MAADHDKVRPISHKKLKAAGMMSSSFEHLKTSTFDSSLDSTHKTDSTIKMYSLFCLCDDANACIRKSGELRGCSLFTRLAQRRSHTSLRLHYPELPPQLRIKPRFTTPKIVRAQTATQALRVTPLRNLSAPKTRRKSAHEAGKKPEEINRIFNADKIKRKIGFDLLLDNYKARIKRSEEATSVGKAGKRKMQKVFAAGKFIGYLKTAVAEGRERGRLYTGP